MIPDPICQERGHVLVAASELRQRLDLQKELEEMGLEVTAAPDLHTALQIASKNGFLLTLLVHDPERMDGIEFLREMDRAGSVNSPGSVVLLSEAAHLDDAVQALELGAADFRLRPWDGKVLELLIKRALSNRATPAEKGGKGHDPTEAAAQTPPQTPPMEQTESPGQEAPSSRDRDETGGQKAKNEGADSKKDETLSGQGQVDRYRIITKSSSMEEVLRKARMVAKSKAPVLIQGESGTGKELLARFIHRHSDRSAGPFVALNCAALPETLLESELFGHEKGAFSGALSRKAGKFELAHGGTILLDEITEMALALQAKLLRVLQEGEVDRLGGTGPIRVDVRVVATTNRDVLKAVREGKFREDLYFRLNVIPMRLPPLRERNGDALYLAQEFLKEFCTLYGKNGLEFASDVIEFIKGYSWPGNVRELRNMIERGVLLAQDSCITREILLVEQEHGAGGAENFSASGQTGPAGAAALAQEESFNLSDMEREMVKRALAKTQGNRTHAAKLLGISVRTLRNKLSEYRKMGLVL
jgi:two-component system response regulator FlrC